MQGHRHIDGYSGLVAGRYGSASYDNITSTRYSMSDSSAAATTVGSIVSSPYTDGTNGPARYGSETRPANCGVTYIIKY